MPAQHLFLELRRLSALSQAQLHPTAAKATSAPDPEAYEGALAATAKDLRQLKIDAEVHISNASSTFPRCCAQLTYLQINRQLEVRSTRNPIRARIAANEDSFGDTTDYLAPPASPLNTLLALRTVLAAATNTAAALPRTRDAGDRARAELAAARRELRAEAELREALERRICELERAPDEPADGRAEARALADKTRRAIRALNGFFAEHLAQVLEIEELGGAIAGVAEVEADGAKVLKRRGGGQLTLEEAFRCEKGTEEGIEVELKRVVQELMNKSLEAEKYVVLERESAVSRFLVRAKVAEFHPRDARKIKMVDFSGTFED